MKLRDKVKNTVAAEAIKGTSYRTIAERIANDTGVQVSRGFVSGIIRDIRNGSLSLDTIKQEQYIYGVQSGEGIPLYTGHPEISCDSALVASDIHSPYYHEGAIECLVSSGRQLKIDTLILAGDIVDGDSRRHSSNHRQHTLGYQIKATKKLLSYLLDNFETIHITLGNHDEWFAYSVDGEIETPEILSLFVPNNAHDRVKIYSYDRITLYSGDEKWVIPHQQESRSDVLSVGSDLAQKYQANIIYGHQHINAFGYDKYDRYNIISIGGLYDRDKMAYTNLKTSTRRIGQMGFASVIDGIGTLISYRGIGNGGRTKTN